MSDEVTLRELNGADAAAFKQIRLRALKEHPEAFGADYEAELAYPLEKTTEFLDQGSAERFVLGAFVDGALVGIVSGYRDGSRKSAHRGHIGAMYVAPQARGKQIGKMLLMEALNRLRGLAGIEDIILAVTVGTEAAQRLYANAGFERSYVDPRYFKINGVYYDIAWMVLRV